MLSPVLHAQEDEFGNWIMYFGTNRITDDFSIHSEVQWRNHTFVPNNIEQLLLRTGLNYHLKKNVIITAGYGYITSYNYKSAQKAPESKEHRIFQQLIVTNQFNRVKLEHRYRLEQRWVNSDFRNRVRYRLMAFIPLNDKVIQKGTFFLGLYDEIFIKMEDSFFDRNRLYGAIGYQAHEMVQLQMGYLRQTITDYGKNYFQLA